MNSKSLVSSKRRFSRGLVAAQFAALCVVSSSTLAAVVDSGVVNLPITANLDGIYLNVVTGVSANGTVAGWDINAYASGGNLSFFTSSSASNTSAAVVSSGATVAALAPGATVGPASTFGATGVMTTAGTAFRMTGTSYYGFRFQNEANGNSLHYGYAEMSTTAPGGFPATVVRYVYDNVPNTAVTIPGGASAPQFAYTPAAGGTVSFTGGAAVGSSGSGSISVAVGTAGSGTGAPATTTTTCTAPTAPFAGFGQSVTAVGTGATSGGPLSGSCVLGAAAVTQTLTCSESRGGTATAVTFTLSCPAGTQPNLTSTPASGSTVTLPARALGSAATTAPITFQNPGATAATVTCTAPANAAFTASPLSINVPAGGSAATTVSYTSASIGTSTGTLNCTFGAQSFTFGLSGTSVLPAPAFIPVNSNWALALLVGLMSLLGGIFVLRARD